MASKETPTTLMKRDQRQSVVAYVKQECLKHPNPKCLNDMLDTHLDPAKHIDDYDSIQWLKWLMAGGPEYDIFAKKVREYDSSVMCGLVWTTNFVAYRCRTCGISPCMSLCADCFMAGNHEGHDYNMFRSQAGGACDCGDSNVMNPAGFCPRHGPDNQQSAASPPVELLAVSQAMMPRIFIRLLFYLRDTSDPAVASYSMNLEEAEHYIAYLQSLSDMGAAMRRIMTLALINTAQYTALQKGESSYYDNSFQNFRGAFMSLEPSGMSPDPSYTTPGFHQPDEYSSMLEELVFWLCKCEFPQSMVTLLLGLLPDDIYKDEFTIAFVRHYSKIVRVLTKATDRSTVANRVVHISVQLFSNERLATRMVAEQQVLRSVIDSLNYMLTPILVPSTILGGPLNRHQVVECEKPVMKEHCYWPVVSDLINLLSHKAVSHSFLQQTTLRAVWMDLLTNLQGMNLNMREMTHHVEYEPDTYYAAFSAELEISASPMWSLINHCTSPESKGYVVDMIKATLVSLDKWFAAIDFRPGSKPHDNQLTFHLPLHRYLAAFLTLGVQSHGISLSTVLPSMDKLCQIIMHPLQVQVCIPQIYAGMWVRNGIQIKGQAMTYIQCHFCYSMSDLDIYLLQVCAASMQPDQFLDLVLDRFCLHKWLSFERDHRAAESESNNSSEMAMLDGCLGFLCALISIRTYLGMSEEEQVRKEMAALLCMNDRQHSQLSELMPERSGMSGIKELFEPTLSKLADYKAPSFEAGSGLNQGSYTPKGSVWMEDFDPVMVAQRAIYKKDFQASMDRYTTYVRTNGMYKGKNTPWPPFKMPGKIHGAYAKLYSILNCATMHAFLFTILYKSLHEVPTVPDSILYKTVHLLNLCLQFAPKTFPNVTPSVSDLVKDGELRKWYRTTDVKANVCELIHKVELSPSSSGRDLRSLDLSNSSLEEMFNIQPSVLSAPSGPITAAQTGQFPSMSMPSGSTTSMSTSPQPVTAPAEPVKPKYQSRGVTTSASTENREKMLGESIISLLVKLHDKLSFPPAIYKPQTSWPCVADSCSTAGQTVGDGAFYIAQFLDRLSVTSCTAARYVQSTCTALHHNTKEDKPEDSEKTDIKRRKAYDRQQRLMAKFASKQMAFMAQAQQEGEEGTEEEMVDSEDVGGATCQPTVHKYDCVICNQCTPSKPSKLMGLVVFLQSTSVLGHRLPTEVQESLISPPSSDQVSETRCSGIKRRRHAELLKHFEETSCDLSINIGWEGGVFASTCGHYLHLDCQKSYINTLKHAQNQPQNEPISFNRGEFYCPMCRQISNGMLPIAPDDDDHSSVARPVSSDPGVMVRDIADMMFQKPKQTQMVEMVAAIKKTLEAVYNIAYRAFHVLPNHDDTTNTFLFITSLARTNLELELLFRGGNLEQPLSPTISKKLCLSPLLAVLNLYLKDMRSPAQHIRLWSHITGVALTDDSTSVQMYRQHVPLLMKDVAAQLCQLLLVLPLNMHIDHFMFVVHKLYCVTYIQALTVLTCRLTQDERQAWCKKGSEAQANSLQRWLHFIISQLSASPLYREMDNGNDFLAICQSVWSPQSVEAWLEEFCLPFLRVAALLRQHMFGPAIEETQEQSEFKTLVRYLGMVAGGGREQQEMTGIACLHWAVPDPKVLVQAWCQDLNNFAKVKPSKCKSLINMDDKWARPHLLALPERYYDIFRTYRHQSCSVCRHVPKDPALCLICGAFLCFREQCCADGTTNIYECVSHSVQCGGGTGIFLLVNSSIVVVLRGQRATLWGSVYLDQHGEEDRDLKRGKPLFLSKERLQLLESQWVCHSFEQSCKRWIWHRDRL